MKINLQTKQNPKTISNKRFLNTSPIPTQQVPSIPPAEYFVCSCGPELAVGYTIRIYRSTFRTSLKFSTASSNAESVPCTTRAHSEYSCIRLIIFAFGVRRKFRGDRAKNAKVRMFRRVFFIFFSAVSFRRFQLSLWMIKESVVYSVGCVICDTSARTRDLLQLINCCLFRFFVS